MLMMEITIVFMITSVTTCRETNINTSINDSDFDTDSNGSAIDNDSD